MEQTHEKMMKLVMDLAEQVMQHDESLSTMMEKTDAVFGDSSMKHGCPD